MDLSQIQEINPEALKAEGFDAAIIGMAERAGMEAVICYDIEECIRILMDRDGMDAREAMEFLSFNTIDAFVGPHSPVWVHRVVP